MQAKRQAARHQKSNSKAQAVVSKARAKQAKRQATRRISEQENARMSNLERYMLSRLPYIIASYKAYLDNGLVLAPAKRTRRKASE